MGNRFGLLRRERLVFTVSLVLAGITLGLHVHHLWSQWAPVIASHDVLAPRLHSPLALDYVQHWTASHLTLEGRPALVYDAARFKEIETELLAYGGHPWPYPPTALLIDWPLALLPYIPSLAVWLGFTMGLFLLVLYRTAPHPLTLYWGLAFLGTFENFYFGQNGFLSAALLGAGLLLLDGSPLLGGMLLGVLSYKPHLAALVPLALLVGRRWRALTGFSASAVCLALASLAFFGLDTWVLFFHNTANTVQNLYSQSTWFTKMPTLFAAVRTAGFAVPVAWAVHGLGMLVAVALLVWTWRGQASTAVRCAALPVAMLLFAPHVWFYDLPILSIALAWLGWEGHVKGWLPWEPFWLLCGGLLPYVGFLLLAGLAWPTGSLYLIAPILLLVRRHRWEMASGATGRAGRPTPVPAAR